MESKTEDIIPVIKTRKPERDLNKKKKNAKGSNEYKLISKIGHGAYGTVYKAQQLATQKIVAIKIVEVEEDEFIEDYMTEIDLLQNLSHNNIVKCLGFEKKQNNNNNSNKFCSKGSLRDIMSDKTACPNGYISENLCRNYIYQTLHGLKYLHDQGIIHRDIKCGNLLLTGENDTIKLADFGISTKITHTLKSNIKNNNAGVAMTCIGSPNWMAPEILLGQGATTKSDIWSLGSTLVEMLTGQPPFYNL
ncbi:Pkinase-domain-containing protein, partial [Hanseniaspora valbyensis NRRL Y-1626]